MLRGYLIAEDDGRSVAVGRSLVVGRTRDCGFAIDDSAASRRHVEITCREGFYVWKDLGSTNGTLLNGTRMLAGELKHGDAIQIGETVLRFEVEEVAETGEASAPAETAAEPSEAEQPAAPQEPPATEPAEAVAEAAEPAPVEAVETPGAESAEPQPPAAEEGEAPVAELTLGEGPPAEAIPEEKVAPVIRGKIDRFGVAIGTNVEARYRREGKIRPLTKDEQKRKKLGIKIGVGLLMLGIITLLIFALR